MANTRWTAHQLKQLKKLYPVTEVKVLAKLLRRTPEAVKAKAQIFHLKKKIRGNSPWTPDLEKRLVKLYPKWTNARIAERLGMDEGQISAKAFKLRLFKTEAFHAKHAAKGYFKKGQPPANKGKKMSPELYERCKATMFKKGTVPPNAKEKDGVITERQHGRTGTWYKYIRVRLGKWELLHRYKWEQKHGPIPKGMIVSFKDGNTLNCHLSNLRLISMYENRLRNSGSTMLSDGYVANAIAWRNKPLAAKIRQERPDLIELKRQQLKLKRAINERNNH